MLCLCVYITYTYTCISIITQQFRTQNVAEPDLLCYTKKQEYKYTLVYSRLNSTNYLCVPPSSVQKGTQGRDTNQSGL